MDKLTTERLEQYAHDKHMCNINDEIREMARQLLAYEQAAKNEVALPEALKYAEIYGRAFICVDRSGSVHAVDPSQITLTILNEPAPAQPVSEHSAAIKDVIAERQRQIREEGWTPELDDRYSSGELAGAAACYARYTNARGWVFPTNPSDYQSAEEPFDWPWAAEWWKPTDPRRDLVKAGALILAEIERQDRAAPTQEQK